MTGEVATHRRAAAGRHPGGSYPGETARCPADAEHELSVRVLDTLLRENYANLCDYVRYQAGIPYLRFARGPGLHVPLERGSFLADLRVARHAGPLSLGDVLSTLAAVSDSRDEDGVAAFSRECRQALLALRLSESHRPAVHRRLAALRAHGAGAVRGPRGLIWYDALGAGTGHPVYPAAHCRLGFTADDYLRYAPEYFPRFELAWAALPAAAVRRAGARLASWWPRPEQVGLPDRLAATHELMPVHPVTAREALATALAGSGLMAAAHVAPRRYLTVAPTLSTRTVAVHDDPASHLKLPLPTSTLGRRNRRVIAPGSLADGKLVQRILTAAAGTDPLLGGLVAADEGTYGHAGHEFLGYLLRRYPAGLDDSDIVSLAALLAPTPGEPPRLLIEELAGQWFGGDLVRMLDSYLRVLFETHVRLFVRYGIALEAHQQNTALIVDESGIRLLIKDFDGSLIHLPRLAAALGADAPAPAAFTDSRLLTASDDALADVFITIVVHLCAGAVAFGLAERGLAALPHLLGLIRRRLAAAVGSHAGEAPAALLRARLFDAERLPGKSMVIAGTLVGKDRLGIADVNKFYGTSGPNYLRSVR